MVLGTESSEYRRDADEPHPCLRDGPCLHQSSDGEMDACLPSLPLLGLQEVKLQPKNEDPNADPFSLRPLGVIYVGRAE